MSDSVSSLWQQTAIDFPQLAQLSGDFVADVTIIGAGFTGLRAALELAQQGMDVVVLDAHEPGWGASGRNGGQVNPMGHESPEDIIKHLGEVFEAEIIEAGESAKAVLHGDIKGITVHLKGDDVMLFDKVKVKINEANIPQALIMVELVEKLSKDEMELV